MENNLWNERHQLKSKLRQSYFELQSMLLIYEVFYKKKIETRFRYRL